jgi:hypothetical protein
MYAHFLARVAEKFLILCRMEIGAVPEIRDAAPFRIVML